MAASVGRRTLLLLGLPVAWLLGTACRGADEAALGPADAYRLFAPVPVEERGATTTPVVRPLGPHEEPSRLLTGLLDDGFATEALRTVYLIKQYLREVRIDGRQVPATAALREPVCLVVGAASHEKGRPVQRGLALQRALRGPLELPDVPWIALPGTLPADRAAVPRLAGQLAGLAVQFAATGGKLDVPAPPVLAGGYQMAMEVIAREWKGARGPSRGTPSDAGTPEERSTFAAVRENRFVVPDADGPVRAGGALVEDPGVAATVIYRMAQTPTLSRRLAPAAFYAPLAHGRIPEGVSPAAVLGTFRNFQAKLLGAWADASLRGHAPRDLIDLLELYGATFPEERAEAYRIFVVTTFGATIKPGISPRPKDATATLAALDALTAEALAGRVSLRAAIPVH